jgi:hypothetical protein
MVSKWVRTLAVWTSLAELAVLIAYYWPLAWRVPWFDMKKVDPMAFRHSYVSDLLHSDMAYRMVVTTLVALQLSLCAVFAVQLNRRRVWCCIPAMALELFTLFVAWLGWVLVTSVYLDANGRMTTGHAVGAGVFIGACALYFVLLMANVLVFYTSQWSVREWWVFFLAAFCFLLAAVVGVVIVVSFFTRQIQFGWMFEHAAFILFVAAQLWLFIVDGWLEEDRVAHPPSAAPPAMGGVRIQKVVFVSI